MVRENSGDVELLVYHVHPAGIVPLLLPRRLPHGGLPDIGRCGGPRPRSRIRARRGEAVHLRMLPSMNPMSNGRSWRLLPRPLLAGCDGAPRAALASWATSRLTTLSSAPIH